MSKVVYGASAGKASADTGYYSFLAYRMGERMHDEPSTMQRNGASKHL
jgi:hypothetical protein